LTQKRILLACIAALLALFAIGFADRARPQDKGADPQHKGADFSDALIGEQVKSAINNDAALRTMDISIAVRDGVVHLSGFVNSMSDAARAETLVRKVRGVAGVKNAIRVANRPSRA
jgi:osmotically-inducible protein OsmY